MPICLARSHSKRLLRLRRRRSPLRSAFPPSPSPRTAPRGSAERDQQGLRAAIEALKRQFPGHRIFLGGHSYGGRQASILAASDPALADALLLLSYPLHPPKAPAQLRTAHFPDLRTPALFVSGARDGFATTNELTAALKLIPARTQLLPIEAAGHELLTPRNRTTLPQQFAAALHSPSPRRLCLSWERQSPDWRLAFVMSHPRLLLCCHRLVILSECCVFFFARSAVCAPRPWECQSPDWRLWFYVAPPRLHGVRVFRTRSKSTPLLRRRFRKYRVRIAAARAG